MGLFKARSPLWGPDVSFTKVIHVPRFTRYFSYGMNLQPTFQKKKKKLYNLHYIKKCLLQQKKYYNNIEVIIIVYAKCCNKI